MTDISADTAIATASSAARALSSRFADEYSVEDFGVVNDPSGTNVAANTSAYAAALAAAAGIARLRHRAGLTVFINTQLTFAADTVLQLDGTLKLAVVTSWTSGHCMISAASNSIIEGVGVIDGNAANQTTTSIIGGIGPSGLPGPTNFVVRGITVQNVKNWPFNVNGATNCCAIDCTFAHSGDSAEFANGSTNCHFIGNTVTTISDEGIAIYGGCTNCSVVGNTVSNCTASGISVLNDSAQPAICSNILISGNTSFANALSGIEVNSGTGAVGPHTNVSVISNICYGNGVGNTSQHAISFGNAVHFLCNDNLVYGTNGSGGTGIYASSSSSYGSIVGNSSFNQGIGAGSGIGISIQSPNTNCSNNSVYDDQSSPTTVFGILIGSSTILCANNNISGSIANTINFNAQPAKIAEFLTTGFNIYQDIAGINGIYPLGLSIGWNQSNTYNEVDFILNCDSSLASGGAHWYQVENTGFIAPGQFENGSIIRTDRSGNFGALSYRVGSSSGPTWTSGSGAPSGTQPVGSLYSNTTGTTGSRLYVSAGGGTWNAVPGV